MSPMLATCNDRQCRVAPSCSCLDWTDRKVDLRTSWFALIVEGCESKPSAPRASLSKAGCSKRRLYQASQLRAKGLNLNRTTSSTAQLKLLPRFSLACSARSSSLALERTAPNNQTKQQKRATHQPIARHVRTASVICRGLQDMPYPWKGSMLKAPAAALQAETLWPDGPHNGPIIALGTRSSTAHTAS